MNRPALLLMQRVPRAVRAAAAIELPAPWWLRVWRALCERAERPDRFVPYC